MTRRMPSGQKQAEDCQSDAEEQVGFDAIIKITRCSVLICVAMGEITRQWPFNEDEASPTAFELTIREPPLTGDSLGLKTWGSSYVLAQHLPHIGSTSLFRLFDESLGQPPPPVLELGSGTGLLGLAAAANDVDVCGNLGAVGFHRQIVDIFAKGIFNLTADEENAEDDVRGRNSCRDRDPTEGMNVSQLPSWTWARHKGEVGFWCIRGGQHKTFDSCC